MALKKINKSELVQWVKRYKDTVTDPNETKNALISIEELRSLIAYIDNINGKPGMVLHEEDKRIDGVRIYFIRPDFHPRKLSLEKLNKDGEKIDQMSIAIVPTKDFAVYGGEGGDDYWEDNDNIVSLFPGGEHTGLCPPSCNGSI